MRLLSAVDLGVPGSLLPGMKKAAIVIDCGRAVRARLAKQSKTLLLVHLVL